MFIGDNGSSNDDYCQLLLRGSSKAESFSVSPEDREDSKRNESEAMHFNRAF